MDSAKEAQITAHALALASLLYGETEPEKLKTLGGIEEAIRGRGSSEGNTFDWELNPQSPAKWTSEGSIPDSECYLGGTWIEPHP